MTGLLDYIVTYSTAIEAFLVVLGALVAGFLAKFFLNKAARQAEKTKNYWDDAVVQAGRRPISWGIWIVGITFAAEIAGGDSPAEIFGYLSDVRNVAIVWLLALFAMNFIRLIERSLIEKNSSRSDASLDIATIAALGKLLRASVAITGVLLVLQSLGVSVAGVLAFGGIGGIAIGFAAKDLLANFFGALMIFLDRPFSIGDWIRSPDREIEGVVEDIGWRSTKIRTFDKRPLFIPNSAFASLTVENASKMQNRRIFETIGLRYDDIDRVKLVIDQCRLMLAEHPEIDDQEILMVNFVSFAPSSLDFFVYAHTRTIDWESYHLVKEDILMKIAEIIKENGAQIAFPTQSLEITQMPGLRSEP